MQIEGMFRYPAGTVAKGLMTSRMKVTPSYVSYMATGVPVPSIVQTVMNV